MDHLGKCIALNSMHRANVRWQPVRQSPMKIKHQPTRERHRAMYFVFQLFLLPIRLYFRASFLSAVRRFYSFSRQFSAFFDRYCDWFLECTALLLAAFSNQFFYSFEYICDKLARLISYEWYLTFTNSQLTIFHGTAAAHLLILLVLANRTQVDYWPHISNEQMNGRTKKNFFWQLDNFRELRSNLFDSFQRNVRTLQKNFAFFSPSGRKHIYLDKINGSKLFYFSLFHTHTQTIRTTSSGRHRRNERNKKYNGNLLNLVNKSNKQFISNQ